MEMEKVPAAGYPIEGLPVRGFQRKLTFSNISVLIKLFQSMFKAKAILKRFKPNVVVGVGGFASGPLLKEAQKLGLSTLIQEQNSYAGVTNKLLAKNADKICVAYENMEQFFPAEKIIITGNPVRQSILENIDTKKEDAYKYFKVQANKKIILIVGGSLGALTINESIHQGLDKFVEEGLQIIWQTGKEYYLKAESLKAEYEDKGIIITDFITRMDYAYAIADIVISRAGASTVSELGLIHKPAIFVPSPNVAEDHQTKNAMALIKKDAAMMITGPWALDRIRESGVPTPFPNSPVNFRTRNPSSVSKAL